MTEVAVFRGRDGFRIAIEVETVTCVVELDRGCQLVTDSDTHTVEASWPEAVGLIWPDVLAE